MSKDKWTLNDLRSKLQHNGRVVISWHYPDRVKLAKRLERNHEARIQIKEGREYNSLEAVYDDYVNYIVTPTGKLKVTGTIKSITEYWDYTGRIWHGDNSAQVKDAYFRLEEDGSIVWKDGIWINGTFAKGTWYKGTWMKGTWLKGDWFNGEWFNGTWKDGTWRNGIWHDGEHLNGDWMNGTWEDGVWRGGTWHDGEGKRKGVWYEEQDSYFDW